MSTARVFIPQGAIEAWLTSGEAQVAGERLSLDGVELTLLPAVRVLREVAGGADLGLLGRVKSVEQLTGLGGEVCAGSVVLGDSAFEVVEGFLAAPTPHGPGSGLSHDELVKLLSRR